MAPEIGGKGLTGEQLWPVQPVRKSIETSESMSFQSRQKEMDAQKS